jgi:hypothetical protein
MVSQVSVLNATRNLRFRFDPSAEGLAVNLATAEPHLALERTGVGPGGEVILMPFTFTAAAEVIRCLGANFVFVDVREDTAIDLAAIETVITPRMKAIGRVHFAGRACEKDSILRIANHRRIRLIEDSAPPTGDGWGRLIGALERDPTELRFYAQHSWHRGRWDGSHPDGYRWDGHKRALHSASPTSLLAGRIPPVP